MEDEKKIEQFWRPATSDDVVRVMNGETVEARFRDGDWSWSHGTLCGWAVKEPRWYARLPDGMDGWAMQCQVYDPPACYINKPDPGEGYRLLEKSPPEPKLGTDEVWRLFKTWETTANDNGVQEEDCWYRRRIANNPEIPDSSTAANTSEIPNSCESAPVEPEVLTPAKTLHRVLYLAGPMRGIAFYNFPMFDRVAAALRDVGYEVINPADEDRKEDNFDPTLEPKFANPAYCVVQPGMDFGKIIRRCFEAVMRCDEIVLLPGWENSVGAIAELFIAVWSGKRIQIVYFEENDQMQFVSTPAIDLATAIARIQIARDETKQSKEADDEDILDIAARITRGDRQAVYGPPEQDFKKTADMWTGLFQYMLAEDAKFEPRHVAMALICMKMSREFHQRKKDNWVDIAGYARCGSLCE